MKILCIFICTFIVFLNLYGQENPKLYKVTLLSGQVFVGEIVLKNNEILMIKSEADNRFQFQVSEIKSIAPYVANDAGQEKVQDNQSINEGNVCGIIEVTAGVGNAQNKYTNLFANQYSLSFGTRKIANKDLFVGGGIGFLTVISKEKDELIGFVPIYFSVKNFTSSKRYSPYLGLDIGYSLGLNRQYLGGFYSKLSAGYRIKINHKTSFMIGSYANIQNFYGHLIENNSFGQFKYSGNSSILHYGLNAGIQF